MEDIGGVDVLHAAEQLVQEELVVLGREVVVGLDDLVEVGLHELEDDVNVAELAARWREHDMLDLDDVRVAQQAQQLDLAQDAGGVGDVLEDVVDLLDGDVLAGEGVEGRGDHAVAALAHHLGNLVPARLAVVREERRLLGALLLVHGVACVAPAPIRRDAPLALGSVALAPGVNRAAVGSDGWGRRDGEGRGRRRGAG